MLAGVMEQAQAERVVVQVFQVVVEERPGGGLGGESVIAIRGNWRP